MDDLDRLADRLVANIRDGYPHLLDRTFQLGDVAEHLVPYRLNRRELGFDSVRQYELALMRLASGERGHVRLDAPTQDAFRRALAAPEPDASLLREHARATVALGVAPPTVSPTTVSPAAAAPTVSPAAVGTTGATTTVPTPTAPILAQEPIAVAAPVANSTLPSGPTEIGGPCRYCTRPLPEGRAVTFCPHCGQNVTVRHCPACSTELELGWQYCITCGRMMDEPGVGR